MRASEKELLRFINALHKGAVTHTPTAAVSDFASRARKLGPRELVAEGQALLAKKEDARAVAGIVVGTLRGILGDIEEHGAQSEFEGEGPFVRKAIATWSKHASPEASDSVLLTDSLEEALVGIVESAKLPPEQAEAWKKLRASKRFATAASALVKKPVEPWFAELVAAYIGREVTMIGTRPHADSWQAKLDDVPKLLGVLRALGFPPVFSPRVLRAANNVVLRHEHGPTREALESMGALRLPKADREKVERARANAEIIAKARAANRPQAPARKAAAKPRATNRPQAPARKAATKPRTSARRKSPSARE